jgi:hypothetical protein
METFITVLAILAGVSLFVALSIKVPGFAGGCVRLVVAYLKWAWRVSSVVIKAFNPR